MVDVALCEIEAAYEQARIKNEVLFLDRLREWRSLETDHLTGTLRFAFLSDALNAIISDYLGYSLENLAALRVLCGDRGQQAVDTIRLYAKSKTEETCRLKRSAELRWFNLPIDEIEPPSDTDLVAALVSGYEEFFWRLDAGEEAVWEFWPGRMAHEELLDAPWYYQWASTSETQSTKSDYRSQLKQLIQRRRNQHGESAEDALAYWRETACKEISRTQLTDYMAGRTTGRVSIAKILIIETAIAKSVGVSITTPS